MRFFFATASLWVIRATNASPVAEADLIPDVVEERAGPQRFNYYEMPTAGSGPCDLTTGPDGNVWVQDFLINKLQRINPTTGKIDEFSIPYTTLPLNITLPGGGGVPARSGLTACAIQPGKDGNLYAASGVRNQFLKIDLSKSPPKIKVFNTPKQGPLGNLQPFNDLWRGDEGMYFTQTTANKLCQMSYKTEKITCWSPPTPLAGILGLYVATDNLLWFTEFQASKVGSFNQKTHEFKEYKIPGLVPQFPTVTRAQTRYNGHNLVWWTGFASQNMGSIDIDTKEIKTYPLAVPASFPVEDTVDSYGRVWYSTALAAGLNVLNPATGTSRIIRHKGFFDQPPGVVPTADIAITYGPGNKIWFTELAKNTVGTYQLIGCGNTITPCTK